MIDDSHPLCLGPDAALPALGRITSFLKSCAAVQPRVPGQQVLNWRHLKLHTLILGFLDKVVLDLAQIVQAPMLEILCVICRGCVICKYANSNDI